MDPQSIITSGDLVLAMAVAVAAGFVSFASPCILPLVPGYLSYMSGIAGQAPGPATRAEAGAGQGVQVRARSQTLRVVVAAALFVVGFSMVFVALGAAMGALTTWLITYRNVLTRVAGVLVIAFGLVLAGTLRIPLLNREMRVRLDRVPAGMAGALPLGMVFGLGWTPCIGPTLGAVLGLTVAGGGGATRGSLLLFAYSLGLGVPFLVAAVGFRTALGRFPALRRRIRVFELAGGWLLVVIGVLLVTGFWNDMLVWLQVRAGSFTTPL